MKASLVVNVKLVLMKMLLVTMMQWLEVVDVILFFMVIRVVVITVLLIVHLRYL